jgi:hypothetical protein
MKKIIAALLIVSTPLFAREHEEVFIGTGKTAQDARLSAYNSIASQGRSINSFVSAETRETGTNNFITVFKIKTR